MVQKYHSRGIRGEGGIPPQGWQLLSQYAVMWSVPAGSCRTLVCQLTLILGTVYFPLLVIVSPFIPIGPSPINFTITHPPFYPHPLLIHTLSLTSRSTHSVSAGVFSCTLGKVPLQTISPLSNYFSAPHSILSIPSCTRIIPSCTPPYIGI